MTAQSSPPPAGSKPDRPLRAGLGRRCALIALEALAVLIVIAGGLGGLVMWRLSSGPVPLEFARADAERALARAFGGDVVAMGTLEIVWSEPDSTLVLAASDVTVAAVGGRVLARAPRLEAALSAAALVQGRADLAWATAVGGDYAVVRKADGRVVAGFGTPQDVAARHAEPPPGTSAVAAFDWRAALAQVRRGADAFERTRRTRLGELRLRDARVAFWDEARDISLTLEAVAAVMRRSGARVRLHADAVAPLAEGGVTGLAFDIAIGEGRAEAQMRVTDLDPQTLAAGLPDWAGALSAVDTTLDAVVSVTSDAKGETAQASLTAAPGRLTALGFDQALQAFELALSADLDAGAMRLDRLVLWADEWSGAASGEVTRRADGSFDITLEALDLKVRPTPAFGLPLDATRVSVRGAVDLAAQSVRLDELDLALREGSGLTVSGEARLLRQDEQYLPDISLEGVIRGRTSPQTLVGLWPKGFADGGRDWIEDAIPQADIYGDTLYLRIRPEDILNRRLPNEAMKVTFRAENATVRYVSTMTPIENAQGRGVLYGNRFEANMDRGTLMNSVLYDGYVEIPRLNPKGATARFGAFANGPIPDAIRLLDEEPLGFITPYGVAPDDFDGAIEVDFEITRPMRREVAPEDVGYRVDGAMVGITAPTSIQALPLTDGHADIHVDPEGLQATGTARIGPLPTYIVWREVYGLPDGAPGTRFEVASEVDSADLDAVGLPMRAILTGPVRLEATAVGNGLDVETAAVRADLTNAVLGGPGDPWFKPEGASGHTAFTVSRDAAGGVALEDFRFTTDAIDARGRIALDADSRLDIAELDRLRVGDVLNMSAQVTRDPDAFRVDADADRMDARGLLDGLLTQQTTAARDLDAAAPPGVRGDIRFAEALIGDAVALREGRLIFDHTGERFRALDFTAQAPGGPMSIMITPGENGVRHVAADAQDGGALASALFGVDQIEGGRVKVVGDLTAPGGGESRLQVTGSDFRLVKAPAFARVLALGSLRGLSDQMSGDGILFTRLDAPISLDDGMVWFDQASASGPALGVTLNGAVNTVNQSTDLQGVLVPSFGLNAAIGAVPVLGDLLTSREGEGVFGLTYSITGPLEATRVFVNPLSAFAPGVLRRIFEGPNAAARPDDSAEARAGGTSGAPPADD